MSATTKISYAQALAEAIRIEMQRSADVLCVAAADAAGRSPVVAELSAAFGPDRVVELDAGVHPIAAAAGMAARGARVVCEARLARLGPEGLAPLAELDSELEGAVVARIPDGGPEPGAVAPAPLADWALETPLAVAAPATPADAKGLLTARIRGGSSCCLLEAEQLYGTVGDVPEGSHPVEAESARVEGDERLSRVSVVAYGLGSRVAAAARDRSKSGFELVDLRLLRPLDRNAVAASVGRTGKAAVLEPAASRRVTGEVAAMLLSEAFELLDGPLARIELPAATDIDEAAATVAERVDDLAGY